VHSIAALAAAVVYAAVVDCMTSRHSGLVCLMLRRSQPMLKAHALSSKAEIALVDQLSKWLHPFSNQ
jgi:hypothetical protein